MKNRIRPAGAASLFLILLIFSAGCAPEEAAPLSTETVPAGVPREESSLEPVINKVDQTILDLGSFFSQPRMMGTIQDLAEIQPYAGWRSSATSGEAEALAYLNGRLDELSFLNEIGLELERQSFNVLLATEIWQAQLFLVVDGEEIEVPANGIAGHKEVLSLALRFDSDGDLNDRDPDPVQAAGNALLLRTEEEILNLPQDQISGKVIFLDYRLIEPAERPGQHQLDLISPLIEKQAAGIVLMTESPGCKGAGDGKILEYVSGERIPILTARIEDLAPAGILSWEDFDRVQTARLVWDADVLSPGKSGNLVARIPGADPSRAVILGAHIDSANTPGASDNALNAAVLLETAAILDEAGFQPPADLYLIWVGSEELGFHGAQHFVNTHSDLLDRTLGVMMLDGFTADEPEPILAMQASSYARFGDTQTPFASYLEEKAGKLEVPILFVVDSPVYASDEGPFFGFAPAVRFAYGSSRIGRSYHGPYDDLDILTGQEEMMQDSVVMALAAAVGTPQDTLSLRILPEPAGRALILATHTDPLHMGPSMLTNFVRALAWNGLDVDLIPYGSTFAGSDLADAALVLALPVVDYPAVDDGPGVYDESWLPEEVDSLVQYVEEGGLLLLANSANRLLFANGMDPNEDWDDLNDLAVRFGVEYAGDPIPISSVPLSGEHPLTDFYGGLGVLPHNGVPFTIREGNALALWQDQLALALVPYGDQGGEVLVFADLGSLDLYDFNDENDLNQTLLKNIAFYARGRIED